MILAVSPVGGVFALAFLFVFSLVVVIAVQSIKGLINELKNIKEKDLTAPKQKVKSGAKGLTINPKRVSKIYFKDED